MKFYNTQVDSSWKGTRSNSITNFIEKAIWSISKLLRHLNCMSRNNPSLVGRGSEQRPEYAMFICTTAYHPKFFKLR